MAENEGVRVPVDRVREQIEAVFRAWGMSEEWIPDSVGVMAETDVRGVDSHGIAMLPRQHHTRGPAAPTLTPAWRLEREAPGIAGTHADRGLGHAISVKAMRMAVDKAKAMGIAAVAVRNSHHFGAAGAYPLIAAREGLIGFACTNALSAIMVPTRAKQPFYATNPLAFAAPTRRNRPFVLDMSTTTGAVGKVKLAWYAGKLLPEGWLVDADGRPMTDPEPAFDGRGRMKTGYGVTPLGSVAETASHKGYGLGGMVEILAALLSGSSSAGEPRGRPPLGRPEDVGHFFMAIDPTAFREAEEYLADIDAMIDALHALPAADPAEPVMVAGEPEDLIAADRTANGVPMPRKLLDQLKELCRASNAAYVLPD